MTLRRLFVDEYGLFAALHARLGDDDFLHALLRRDLIHDIGHQPLDDGAQAPGARFQADGGARDLADGVRLDRQFDPVHAHEFLILLDDGVLGLGEDLDERVLVQRVEADHDGKPADELGNEPEFGEVLRLDFLQQGVIHFRTAQTEVAAEAHGGVVLAGGHDLIQPDERPAADEENVGRVDLQALLLRVLSAALRGHGRDRAFDDLQKRLLHALARNVARDGHVLALARDLVDLVDVHDAALRLFNVVIGVLDEFQEDIFHVLADIARLGERGGVRRGEGHVQDLGKRPREQGLAAARGAEEQDVALFDLDVVVEGFLFPHFRLRRVHVLGEGELSPPLSGGVRERVDALVVVIHRDGEHLFGVVLPDDILVEFCLDLGGLFELDGRGRLLAAALVEHILAKFYALVADENVVRPRDELFGKFLPLAAEGTVLFIFFHK